MADINVVVHVDTANITPENLSTSVVLTDDHAGDGDDTPGNSTTFDIHASANQTVKFTIRANDTTTETSLVEFGQETGPAIFSTLPSSSNDFEGKVSADLIGIETYYIKFNVSGNDNSPFKLDPIIKKDS